MRSLVSALVVSCVSLASLACSSASTNADDSAGAGNNAGSAGSVASAGNDALGGDQNAGGGGADIGGTGGADLGGSAGLGGASLGGSAGTAGSAGAGGGTQTGFHHPGVLVSQGMLDYIKARITMDPWKSALAKAQTDSRGKTSYTPTKTVDVICYSTSGPGSVGCDEEKSDAEAAYIHALLWYYTGNQANANKAIEIMDLYANNLKEHTQDNAQLQSGWVASVFTRAAEIIRYTKAGWLPASATKFGDMLTNAYMPYIKDFSTRTGNWDASTIEAVIAIAVYNDDHVNFQRAVDRWRLRVPAWVYMTADGKQPVSPPGGGTLSASAMKSLWINPTNYVEGLAQETCKDHAGAGGTDTGGMGHMQYGLAALLNAAETARIQGVDLFTEQEKRLVTTLEFHAKYLNSLGTTPSSLCAAGLNDLTIDPMWEIGYNALAGVLGQSLPETKKLVASQRASGKVLVDHHMVWEVLSHGDIGAAGL